IVGTPALGSGVDYPEVRFVNHFGAALTLMGQAQEMGRAGRDHKKSFAQTFWWTLPWDDTENSLARAENAIHAGRREWREALANPPGCWREPFGLFFDGIARNCYSIPKAHPCNLCLDRRVSFFLSQISDGYIRAHCDAEQFTPPLYS
ncbi:hypothetical protein SISSUDRAFT_993919, partial [Sistotremastrum suecicum HHB10207 ss-3]